MDFSFIRFRYMFQAPRRNTNISRRYKGLINAKRGRKDNSYREEHQDAHFLFARVAYRLEMAAMFADKTAVLSCDDINKVKVGAPAVSRYHQLSRYFEIGDSPNLRDHDFPMPGYLVHSIRLHAVGKRRQDQRIGSRQGFKYDTLISNSG